MCWLCSVNDVDVCKCIALHPGIINVKMVLNPIKAGAEFTG